MRQRSWDDDAHKKNTQSDKIMFGWEEQQGNLLCPKNANCKIIKSIKEKQELG